MTDKNNKVQLDMDMIRDLSNLIDSEFNGITVFGDVHGNFVGLNSVIEHAKLKNHYLLSLGDMIDYGAQIVECINQYSSIVKNNLGAFIEGNHEYKFMKYLNPKEPNKKIKISRAMQATIDQMNKLNDIEKDNFINNFKYLYNKSSLIIKIKNYRFTHGAIHPSHWSQLGNSISGKTRSFALYAEVENGKFDPITGYPIRTHNWNLNVPADKMVIVGHDYTRSPDKKTPYTTENNRVIYLDTGSGKGGILHSIDLLFDNGEIKLGSFINHT